VICAVDGSPYGDAADIQERMKRQVFSPVRWVDTIMHMKGEGIAVIVECGPGKVLAGLIKRIDRALSASCIDTSDALQKSLDGAV